MVQSSSREGGVSPCQVPGERGCPETPPVNRITHTCKNITLATTSLRPVINQLNCWKVLGKFSLSLPFQSVWTGLYTCYFRIAGQCSGVYSGVWRPVSARVHHWPRRSIRRHVQQQQDQARLFIPIILMPVSLPSHADHRIRGDAREGQQSTGTVYNIFIDGYRTGRTIRPLWNFLFIFKQFMTINRLTPFPSARNPGSTTDFVVGLRRKSFHFFKNY